MTEGMQHETSENSWLTGRLTAAPICSVLVMEDRAQITRRGRLMLAAGRHSLAVMPVTPLVTDRSLRCRVRPEETESDGSTQPARILDLQVNRRYLTKPARAE